MGIFTKRQTGKICAFQGWGFHDALLTDIYTGAWQLQQNLGYLSLPRV